MWLTHPNESGAFRNVDVLAPKIFDRFIFLLPQNIGRQRSSRFGEGINAALQFRFQQMGDKIVIICIELVVDDERFLTFVVTFVIQIVDELKFIQSSTCIDEILVYNYEY